MFVVRSVRGTIFSHRVAAQKEACIYSRIRGELTKLVTLQLELRGKPITFTLRVVRSASLSSVSGCTISFCPVLLSVVQLSMLSFSKRANSFNYVHQRADIITADFSKTQLFIPKQSRWLDDKYVLMMRSTNFRRSTKLVVSQLTRHS